jgi:hypothetical protein
MGRSMLRPYKFGGRKARLFNRVGAGAIQWEVSETGEVE